MNTQIKFLLIGIVLGGLIYWTISSNLNFGQKTTYNQDNSVTEKKVDLDAHFIEQMIPHHEDAITMAKLAETKSTKAEVKQLAQNIISSQSNEIIKMRHWYQDWFGRELPTGNQTMSTHGMMSNSGSLHMDMTGSDINNLDKAADFDKVFITQMIPHHQMAVMMASMVKSGSSRTEIKDLADQIIIAQTAEIDQMRQWLADWN